jgi:hypothetical protein
VTRSTTVPAREKSAAAEGKARLRSEATMDAGGAGK